MDLENKPWMLVSEDALAPTTPTSLAPSPGSRSPVGIVKADKEFLVVTGAIGQLKLYLGFSQNECPCRVFFAGLSPPFP